MDSYGNWIILTELPRFYSGEAAAQPGRHCQQYFKAAELSGRSGKRGSRQYRMRRISMRNVFICAALGLGLAATTAMAQAPGRISVSVSGLHSDNGVVRCGLYASADTFRKPGREVRGVVARPNGQRATCVFSGVAAGSYAVAVFHAEQNEALIEYGMFGKPKQGYGFSRNPSSTFGPPNFERSEERRVGKECR